VTRRCRCEDCRTGRDRRRRTRERERLEIELDDGAEFLGSPYYPFLGPIEWTLTIAKSDG